MLCVNLSISFWCLSPLVFLFQCNPYSEKIKTLAESSELSPIFVSFSNLIIVIHISSNHAIINNASNVSMKTKIVNSIFKFLFISFIKLATLKALSTLFFLSITVYLIYKDVNVWVIQYEDQ